jgi:hypothetical protein
MRDYVPILDGVLSAAASALNAQGRPTGRVERTPGILPAWDDCCEGQLYLRLIEVYPTAGKGAPFPQFDAAQQGAAGGTCSLHALGFRIGLGVIRCAATVDDDGNAPAPVAVTADADVMLDDMATLLDVLVCTVAKMPGVMALKMDRWQPKGVEGGCHGGEWGAVLALDPCLCQPLPEPLP